MSRHRSFTRARGAACALVFAAVFVLFGRLQASRDTQAQQTPAKLGGAYAVLGARRQQLINDWVERFTRVTGKKVEPAELYDSLLKLSTKTTFEAVTNALITTSLTESSGQKFGDGLDLIERLETVKGQVIGAAGDRQFRIYVLLKETAIDMLERSQEFKRGVDNSFYHSGYPISYRQQGGAPSIQFSIATNKRNADIDVDYRSPIFPGSMFNGHLTAANSDVRAGNNYDRYLNRWSGLQNWWHSFFGVRVEQSSQENEAGIVPGKPRAGNKNIDSMMHDFLTAWLLDGDLPGALSYVSDRAYACLAEDGDDPMTFDRGMAPIELALRLKASHEALGKRESLEGLVIPVRLPNLALTLVRHSYRSQFVIYSVPDDIAARFDCESRLALGDPTKIPRAYGNYFGATFYIKSQKENGKDYTMALLWARENSYWKIVSWQSEPQESDDTPAPPDLGATEVASVRVPAEPGLADAAKDFLESWLIRKDYTAAFRYVSPASYACYNLAKSPEAPAAATDEEAGKQIRASLERAGDGVGTQKSLDGLIESLPSLHPAVRLLEHPYSGSFALTSLPNALAQAVDCAARARGEEFKGDIPLEYGGDYGMTFRFKTLSGYAPVLRTMWVKENGAWRITAYGIEAP